MRCSGKAPTGGTNQSAELWMIPLNADVFCQKIEAVCDAWLREENQSGANKAYLELDLFEAPEEKLTAQNTNPNAWIAIDHGLGIDHRLAF